MPRIIGPALSLVQFLGLGFRLGFGLSLAPGLASLVVVVTVILVSILLGPNLALISYLCGVSAPSGSARLAYKSPRLQAADTRAKAHPEPSRQVPGRHWEVNGDGFWLLPFALWKRGVLLIPAMVGWA